MSTSSSGAAADYSNGNAAPRDRRRPSSRLAPARIGLALAGLGGVAALLAATPATVVRIAVAGSSQIPGYDTQLSGWDRHGPALVLVAVFALVVLGLALRASRTAAAALAVAGVLALVIVLGTDAGELDETGPISEAYDEASAGAGAGFYLETAGGVLLLLSGGGLTLLGVSRRAEP